MRLRLQCSTFTVLQFQFLIGRLDAPQVCKTGREGGGFQFLIGRLDAETVRVFLPRSEMFQFLIGRLDAIRSAIQNKIII